MHVHVHAQPANTIQLHPARPGRAGQVAFEGGWLRALRGRGRAGKRRAAAPSGCFRRRQGTGRGACMHACMQSWSPAAPRRLQAGGHHQLQRDSPSPSPSLPRTDWAVLFSQATQPSPPPFPGSPRRAPTLAVAPRPPSLPPLLPSPPALPAPLPSLALPEVRQDKGLHHLGQQHHGWPQPAAQRLARAASSSPSPVRGGRTAAHRVTRRAARRQQPGF